MNKNIGYAIAPPALTRPLRAVHQTVTFSTATPLQEAMAVALESAPALGYYDELAAESSA